MRRGRVKLSMSGTSCAVAAIIIMIKRNEITLRLTLIMTPCWLIMDKALKRGKNRYDGQHGCRIRKTTLPDSRYRTTAIDPLRYLPPPGVNRSADGGVASSQPVSLLPTRRKVYNALRISKHRRFNGRARLPKLYTRVSIPFSPARTTTFTMSYLQLHEIYSNFPV